MGITAQSASNAPRLNLTIDELLEVDPSGKIIIGVLADLPAWMSF